MEGIIIPKFIMSNFTKLNECIIGLIFGFLTIRELYYTRITCTYLLTKKAYLDSLIFYSNMPINILSTINIK